MVRLLSLLPKESERKRERSPIDMSRTSSQRRRRNCQTTLSHHSPQFPPQRIWSLVGIILTTWGVVQGFVTTALSTRIHDHADDDGTLIPVYRQHCGICVAARWATAAATKDAEGTTTRSDDVSTTLTTSHTVMERLRRTHPGYSDAVRRPRRFTHGVLPHPSWRSLVPEPWCANPRGVDVTVQWRMTTENKESDVVSDTAHRMVRTISQTCLNRFQTELSQSTQQAMQRDLQASMMAFADAIRTTLSTSPQSPPQSRTALLQARLVASRGSVSSKCPVWHVDHVPVRWIQSMVGPGVEWVQTPDAVRWEAFHADKDENEDDEDAKIVTETPRQINRRLVAESSAEIGRARPGEPVLLLGVVNGDGELDCCQGQHNPAMATTTTKTPGDNSSTLGAAAVEDLRPAVHKSPTMAWPWQGRVLLTMDVVEQGYTKSVSGMSARV